MAALRGLARSVLLINKNIHCYNYGINDSTQLVKRWARFENSPFVKPDFSYTDFEVSTDPKEWSQVERCLRPKFIPVPPKVYDNTPSGWKAQKPEAKNHPYFIERSKNHQQSVYLRRSERGQKRVTTIRKIQGDIVALEAELRGHLEEITGDKIGTKILEPNGVIHVRGDYVNRVREWMDQKGF